MQLGRPSSVRTEEWVNALGSDQADPTDTALGMATASAPYALGDTRLVRVGVAASDLPTGERPPAHLTFVVDTSGVAPVSAQRTGRPGAAMFRRRSTR